MRRLLFAWFTLCVLMFATCAMAQEPARLALLIGNQSYGADVGPLKNPQNDVALMLIRLTTYAVALATLTRIGFGGMSRIADFVSLVPRRASDGSVVAETIHGARQREPQARPNGLRPC